MKAVQRSTQDKAGVKHLAILQELLSRIQFHRPRKIRFCLSFVEEAMEECEDVRGLEPTWEELKDQPLVAVDALSKSLLFTSSTHASIFDHDSRRKCSGGCLRPFARDRGSHRKSFGDCQFARGPSTCSSVWFFKLTLLAVGHAR